MYRSGEEPRVGDFVRGRGGSGEVMELTTDGAAGETATVQWTTPSSRVPGSNAPLAPSAEPTRSLTLDRRKPE